jgi:hypothetical protein
VFPEFSGRAWHCDAGRVARACADRAFFDAMLACGTARWLACLIWLSVRAWGWRAI